MQKSVTSYLLGAFPTQSYHPALVLESQRFVGCEQAACSSFLARGGVLVSAQLI